MLSRNGSALRIYLGSVAQGLGASEPLRQCDECRHQDFAHHGRPYWHRSHQLPGVRVCHKHGRPLKEIISPAHGAARHLLFLPRANNRFPVSDYRVIAHGGALLRSDVAMALAQWSHLLLHANLPPRSPQLIRAVYIERLIELGLASPSGRVRQRRLTEHVLGFHDGFRYLVGGRKLADQKAGVLPWVAKLVRTPRGAQHPLRHLLLSMTLFSHWTDFQNVLTRKSRFRRRNTPPPLVPSTADRLRTLLADENQSLRQAAKKLRLSVTTVRVHAERLGLHVAVRPKHVYRETIVAIRRYLAEGRPIAQVARLSQISEVTIYRILRSHPPTFECRREFLFRCERTKRRQRLRKSVRRINDPDRQTIRRRCARDIIWLRRHDRPWLRRWLARFRATNTVRRSRVDWHKRDRAFLRLLQNAVDAALVSTGKPNRITLAEIGRRTGRRDWIEKHLSKLPRCREFLRNAIETREHFRLRRVKWAMDQLRHQGTTLVAWRVRRLAGLGRDEEEAVRSLIESAIRPDFANSVFAPRFSGTG